MHMHFMQFAKIQRRRLIESASICNLSVGLETIELLPVHPIAAARINTTAESAHEFNRLAITVALMAPGAGSLSN